MPTASWTSTLHDRHGNVREVRRKHFSEFVANPRKTLAPSRAACKALGISGAAAVLLGLCLTPPTWARAGDGNAQLHALKQQHVATMDAMGAFALRFVRKGQAVVSGGPLPITYKGGFGTSMDANGWFTFGVHPSAVLTFFNPNNADDSGDGRTYATGKKTERAALELWLSGKGGDRLMIPYGATFTQPADYGGWWTQFGSVYDAYPTGIQSFDPADPTNQAKWGRALGLQLPTIIGRDISIGASFFGGPNYFGDYIPGGITSNNYFIQGVKLAAPVGSGAISAGFNGPRRNIVYQNVILDRVTVGTAGHSGGDGSTGASNTLLSKFVSYGQYNTDHSAALAGICDNTDGFCEQDGVYYHCGWPIGSSRDYMDSGSGVRSHDFYYHATCTNGRSDRICHVDSANDGTNFRGGMKGSQHFCWRVPIAATIGGKSGTYDEAPSGRLIQLDDLGVVDSAHIQSSTPRNWLINSENTVLGSYVKNVVALDSHRKNWGDSTLMWLNISGSYLATMYLDVINLRAINYASNHLVLWGGSGTPRSYNLTNARVDTLSNYNEPPFDYSWLNKTDVSVATTAAYPAYRDRVGLMQDWCGDMNLSTSGTEQQLMKRIMDKVLVRPDIQWAPMFLKRIFQVGGITPTYQTLNFLDMSSQAVNDTFVWQDD